MKRLIAFASATVLGLSVAACGGAEEEVALEEDTMVEEPMMGDDLGATDDMGMEAETDVLGEEGGMTEGELTEEEMGAEGVVEEETM